MLVLAALVVVNLYVFVWDKQTSVGAIKRAADRATPTAMVPSHPLAERAAGSGSASPPVGRPGGVERGDTGAGSHGSDGAGSGTPRDPDGSAGRAGARAPHEIKRSETEAGDPDAAGGAGGKAPRGINRSEAGARDPDGSDGGAGSAPRGIHGKVGRSDTLGRVLKRSGLSAAEADEVIRALSGVFDFRTMRAGQTFRIERGPDGRVQSFELAVGKTQNVRADRRADGALIGTAVGAQPRSERDPRP